MQVKFWILLDDSIVRVFAAAQQTIIDLLCLLVALGLVVPTDRPVWSVGLRLFEAVAHMDLKPVSRFASRDQM